MGAGTLEVAAAEPRDGLLVELMGARTLEVADTGAAGVPKDICPKAAKLTAHKINARRAPR
jgi:hypothetical protein